MTRVLVAFASSEGQTERIAHHVARRLEDMGHITRLVDLKAADSEAGVDDCEAAILAGSIHRGKLDPVLSTFVMRHGPALRAHPSAFFTVSLTAASHDAHERAAIDEIARAFLHDTGWHPDIVSHAAGAVHDDRLGFLARTALHVIVDSKGVERHPSGHTELTDWAEVDAVVADLASRIRAAGGPPADAADA